ncbi:class I poly(R)-hydroxyalkanoic acid synthase [Larsenimonas suaedae]|uniref:Class I poly(R)-hydroxyalkanoic acid synthase n=1 Tax=Larsenimonas suaedae TaxID=1851019 RepID=A0ABU1GUW4_9GAMM|nr:class I poly(R)-hydroxyalkanoic acid synthase [Larsenimonas suaedae]MCM2971070.1 class I poly(R)-hydroxyalkanoic acid synthase [Larsenimonas suaedae]MDR5895779.1 class I poly(R)-hydroxyalkanoic acid synthase [Larsenimonas suaedae]
MTLTCPFRRPCLHHESLNMFTSQSPFSPFLNPFGAPMFEGLNIPMFNTETVEQWLANLPGMSTFQQQTLDAERFPKIPPETLFALSSQYSLEVTQLWQQMLMAQTPQLDDPRFTAEAWRHPVYGSIAALYLLNTRFLLNLAEALEGDRKTCARVRFCIEQWVAASAPNNFLNTNPEALSRLEATGGESLRRGIENFWSDFAKGRISQTNEGAFEVGRDVAQTPGEVIFENELIQLIQYYPTTDKVHETPLLIVPPCINKFYILDLQPKNSLVRFALDQGHNVFLISWRNIDDTLAHSTWDDYVDSGVMTAIRVMQDITRQKQVNTLGFCVGGTLLSCALSVFKSRGETPAKSLTLLTSMLDYTDTGMLDVFIDENAVRYREKTIGGHGGLPPRVLKAHELANAFSFLRPKDLVWNYVVGNYLKGDTPPPFDLLYWNSDGANLPGPMFAWYLRHTYLQNDLKTPGAVTVCDHALDLSALEVPAYLYASKSDHIVPWQSVYRSACVLGGNKRFVLGASGHIAGVINPPIKNKRCHWLGQSDDLSDAPDAWIDDATEHPGSWWTDWANWLDQFGGPRKARFKTPGNATYTPIEKAPGRYVKTAA